MTRSYPPESEWEWTSTTAAQPLPRRILDDPKVKEQIEEARTRAMGGKGRRGKTSEEIKKLRDEVHACRQELGQYGRSKDLRRELDQTRVELKQVRAELDRVLRWAIPVAEGFGVGRPWGE